MDRQCASVIKVTWRSWVPAWSELGFLPPLVAMHACKLSKWRERGLVRWYARPDASAVRTLMHVHIMTGRLPACTQHVAVLSQWDQRTCAPLLRPAMDA